MCENIQSGNFKRTPQISTSLCTHIRQAIGYEIVFVLSCVGFVGMTMCLYSCEQILHLLIEESTIQVAYSGPSP